MFIYGKTATNGIAVMSYLAAVSPQRAVSAEIAKARNISRVVTAKLLTQLSSSGLVIGQPGPGGGYTLARAAADIRLVDIVSLFSQMEEIFPCPFGSGWCGIGDPCPLHNSISGMMNKSREFLEHTRLSVFQSPQSAPKAKRSARTSATR